MTRYILFGVFAVLLGSLLAFLVASQTRLTFTQLFLVKLVGCSASTSLRALADEQPSFDVTPVS
jgi:hypothetical protein